MYVCSVACIIRPVTQFSLDDMFAVPCATIIKIDNDFLSVWPLIIHSRAYYQRCNIFMTHLCIFKLPFMIDKNQICCSFNINKHRIYTKDVICMEHKFFFHVPLLLAQFRSILHIAFFSLSPKKRSKNFFLFCFSLMALLDM